MIIFVLQGKWSTGRLSNVILYCQPASKWRNWFIPSSPYSRVHALNHYIYQPCGQNIPSSSGSQRVILSGSPEDRNYFHNNTEIFFLPFSFSFSSKYTKEFSRSYRKCDCIIISMANRKYVCIVLYFLGFSKTSSLGPESKKFENHCPKVENLVSEWTIKIIHL